MSDVKEASSPPEANDSNSVGANLPQIEKRKPSATDHALDFPNTSSRLANVAKRPRSIDTVDHSQESPVESKEPSPTVPVLEQGRLAFTLNRSLQQQFICGLCKGYLREPYRITTCMHAFCKSCLMLALERAGHQCPSCKMYLGRLAVASEINFKPDRLLHDLMDKVLFPELAQADEEAEDEFYASLGIQKKAEIGEKKGKANHTRSNSDKSRMISFQLVPSSGDAVLQRPFLETASAMPISVLKKYLQQQEQKTVTDILCLGTVLGNEWSIDFVWKTVWKPRYPRERKLLMLEYR